MARSTIAKVLREHGIKPAPERPIKWQTFLRTHAPWIAAADFFTTEVWTVRGLVTCYTFFVLDLSSRAVRIAGAAGTFWGRGRGEGADRWVAPVLL